LHERTRRELLVPLAVLCHFSNKLRTNDGYIYISLFSENRTPGSQQAARDSVFGDSQCDKTKKQGSVFWCDLAIYIEKYH
jgi:hypothetical protein